MDEPKKITTLQRKTPAGPKPLSEFATQVTKLKSTNQNDAQNEKFFTVSSTYVRPEGDEEEQIFENIKLFGSVGMSTILETNVDINCVKYTEEFDRVAAGFADGAVRLFQSSTMQLFTTLIDEEVKKANTPVTSIKHRPVSRQYPIENMITCSYLCGLVKCWNYNFSQCVYTIREERETYGITYHNKLTKFITYGNNDKIYLYDEETKTQERVFEVTEPTLEGKNKRTSKMYAACFNRRFSSELITAGSDGIIYFWDVRQPTCIRHITGVHLCAEGLDISSRGTELLACACQREYPLNLFDYFTTELKDSYDPEWGKHKFYCGKYLTDEFAICGGGDPHVVKLVDLELKDSVASIVNLPGVVTSLTPGPMKGQPKKVKIELSKLPKLAFCSGKNIYQVEFT